MTDQKINEAVARKLGFKKVETSPPHPTIGFRWIGPDGSDAYGIPDYCHSIAAVWEVVNRLAKDNGPTKLSSGPGGWWFDCSGLDESIHAKAAPMVICLAFLKLPS